MTNQRNQPLNNLPQGLIVTENPGQTTAVTIYNMGVVLGSKLPFDSIMSALADREHLSPLQIATTIEGFGFSCLHLRCQPLDPRLQNSPFLVNFAGKLVIVLETHRAGVEIFDPETGYLILSHSNFAKAWDGSLLKIEPAPIPQVGGLSSARSLLKSFLPDNYLFVYIAILVTLMVIASAARPLLIQRLIDEVVYHQFRQNIGFYFTCLAGLLALNFIVYLLVQFIFNHLSIRYEWRLCLFFYRQILRLAPAELAKFGESDIVSRLNLVWTLRSAIASTSILAIVSLVTVIGYLFAICSYSWLAAVIASMMVPLVVGASALSKPTIMKEVLSLFETSKKMNLIAYEGIRSLALLRSIGAESLFLQDKYEAAFLGRLAQARHLSVLRGSISGLFRFLIRTVSLLTVVIAAAQAIDGKLSPGQVFAISLFVSMMVAPVFRLAQFIDSSRSLRMTMEKLTEVLHAESEEIRGSDQLGYDVQLAGQVTFENVSFRYGPDLPWVLQDVSFTIQAGEWAAIVGRSGSGKSTVSKLMVGLLRPTSGRILFDGHDSKSLMTSCLRRQANLILPGHNLFAGSIEENIAYADDKIVSGRLEEATEVAAVKDFTAKLYSGLQYRVRESGLGLSGGERQRISIARGLYQNAKIAIFDEMTANLDGDTEKKVLTNLKAKRRGETTVLVTHHSPVVDVCDKVLVFKEGRLLETGTAAELLATSGDFSSLFGSMVAEKTS